MVGIQLVVGFGVGKFSDPKMLKVLYVNGLCVTERCCAALLQCVCSTIRIIESVPCINVSGTYCVLSMLQRHALGK
jgi:hypothetical protein